MKNADAYGPGTALGCVLLLMTVVPAAAQIAQPARNPRLPTGTTVRVQLPPAPVVTSWSPREQAYPGQTLTINGRDFDPGAFVVRLGTGIQAVTLPVVRGTASSIQVTIPTEYTGWQGAPLSIGQRGTELRELDADYRILNRAAVFSGPSLWHVMDSPTTDIFARGTVSLRLDRLEFAQSGTGTYTETVRLVDVTREYDESCTDGVLGTGERTVRVWNWTTVRAERPVSWHRLPDGRVEIRDIGVSRGTVTHRADVLATVNRDVLKLRYTTTNAGPRVAPYTDRGECRGLRLPTPPSTAVPSVPFRLVEWTLARRAGT